MICFGRGHDVACLPSSYSVLNSFVMAFIRRCSMPVISIAGNGDEQLVQVSGRAAVAAELKSAANGMLQTLLDRRLDAYQWYWRRQLRGLTGRPNAASLVWRVG